MWRWGTSTSSIARIRWPPRVGRVYHHRHVASLAMGRWLVASEHVHHLVVLDDRGDYVLLWTAYPVEQDHGRRKLRRRYEASVARKG